MALTKEQLAARRKGVGGSDAATILGINPYQDIYELYLDKRGELPEETDEQSSFLKESRYWGSVLEEPVAQRYAEETGYKVQRSNQLLNSKEHPFMLANIDRKVVGEDRRIGVEIKTAARPDGWGDSGSAEIPAYIMCQIQHYLKVTEYDVWDLAVLIGNRDYRQYRIEPIEEIINQLVDTEQEFWDRVEAGVPPEPQWQSAATTRLIKALYPGTNGQVVGLTDLAQKYHDVLTDANEQKSMFEKVVEGCKNRIAMIMGPNAVGVLPDGTCYTRKLQKRKEFTVAATEFMVTRHTKTLPKNAVEAIEQGTLIEIEEQHTGVM